jgi:predicted transcriptional regulator
MKQARAKHKSQPAGRAKRLGRPVINPNPIVKLLEENLASVGEIARHLGVSSQAVSQTISGKSQSDRIVAAIAQATGLGVSEIRSMINQAALARLTKQPA